jgi:hypothetical protein
MSVRTESRLLAAICIYFGVFCALITPKISSICGDLLVSTPFFTRVMLSPGALGWLLAFSVVAGIVLWKDSWERLRVPNSFFGVTVAGIAWTFIVAVLWPIIGIFVALAY